MTDVALSHSYINQNQIAKANGFAHLADTTVQVALSTASPDPLGTDDWFDLGVIDGEAGFKNVVETYKAMSGSPETLKGVIKTSHLVSGAFSLKYLTYQGWLLVNGSNITPTITYASGGQDTVATGGGGISGQTLTTGTGFAVGNLCVVGTSIPQLVILESYDSTAKTVTHNRLSAAPADSTTFKLVKGPTLSAAGIKFTMGGAGLIKLKMRILRRLHPSRFLVIEYLPEVIITPGDFTYQAKEPLKGSFSVDAIDQGSSSDAVNYGNFWIVPT